MHLLEKEAPDVLRTKGGMLEIITPNTLCSCMAIHGIETPV